MNRQQKRDAARSGTDKPAARERKPANPAAASERTGPRQYYREVVGEMRKVAWPTRAETINSSIVVVIGVIVMAALIFVFDFGATHLVDLVFG